MSKKEKKVQDAYKLMIDGADGRFGMGTEVQKIIDGINMINSQDELNRLFTLFKDEKTGYSDFGEMIRGEFESDNQKDLDKITAKLKSFGYEYTGKARTPKNFGTPKFTPITRPLTDAAPAAAAAPAAVPESENKEHWEDVVKYYEGNKDPNWKFIKQDTFETGAYIYDYIELDSTDTNDTDAYLIIYDSGVVHYNKLGKGTGRSKGTWEWDGTKPVIKIKDISKNASGYVQPTDTYWEAITEDNKVIGLNSKGPLVKRVQQILINIGYSGETGNPITPDVQACLNDVDNCDGIYGKSTKEMVIQYQKDNGLAVDGIVGQQTYDSLIN